MKRLTHDKERLVEAVAAYINGSTSSEVNVKYGIPASTIRKHKSNAQLKVGAGRPTLLNDEQEQYLIELLRNLEAIGVRSTKCLVMKLASEYTQHVTGIDFNLIFFKFFFFEHVTICILNRKTLRFGKKMVEKFFKKSTR